MEPFTAIGTAVTVAGKIRDVVRRRPDLQLSHQLLRSWIGDVFHPSKVVSDRLIKVTNRGDFPVWIDALGVADAAGHVLEEFGKTLPELPHSIPERTTVKFVVGLRTIKRYAGTCNLFARVGPDKFFFDRGLWDDMVDPGAAGQDEKRG